MVMYKYVKNVVGKIHTKNYKTINSLLLSLSTSSEAQLLHLVPWTAKKTNYIINICPCLFFLFSTGVQIRREQCCCSVEKERICQVSNKVHKSLNKSCCPSNTYTGPDCLKKVHKMVYLMNLYPSFPVKNYIRLAYSKTNHNNLKLKHNK